MTESNIKLSDLWIVGIIDAEGCFDVHIFKNETMAVGEQVQLRLIVTQKDKDEKTLKAVGAYFGAGDKKLTKDSRDGTLQICIQKQDLIINNVVPFFQKNPLLTAKRKDFELWAKCVEIMKNKEHIKPEGLAKIKEISSAINLKEKSVAEISSRSVDLPHDWVLAFLEGDGSLILDIWNVKPRAGHQDAENEIEDLSKESNEKPSKTIDRINISTHKYKVGFRLDVGLHSRDSHILRSLDNHFGNVGNYNLSGKYPHWAIRGIDNCYKHVLPFFEANPPIFPIKNKRFALWKEALLLCYEKKHLTQEGTDRLIEIYNTIREKDF